MQLVVARLPAALGADERGFGGRVALHRAATEATGLVSWWGRRHGRPQESQLKGLCS